MIGIGIGVSFQQRSVGASIPKPATPTGLAATPGDTAIVLDWNVSAGATGYNIYRNGVLVITKGEGETNATDSGLTNGVEYSYTITATNAGGESAQSSPVTATPGVLVSLAWQRYGTVLSPIGDITDAMEGNLAEAQVVLHDGVRYMVVRGGYTNSDIYAATSLDGITWTYLNGGSPVLADYCRPSLWWDEVDELFYMAVANSTFTQIDLFASEDCETWFGSNTAIITASGWCSSAVHNSCIFRKLDGTCVLMYEGTPDNSLYPTGLATASSWGGTFTNYVGNPVVSISGGTAGGPDVHQLGANSFIGWFHDAAVTNVPLYFQRRHSTDLITWTATSVPSLIGRTIDEECTQGGKGGPADASVIETPDGLELYWSADPDNYVKTGISHIKLCLLPGLTLAQLYAAGEDKDDATIQTTLVNDTLTDTDGTAITAHTVAPLNPASGTWTKVTGAGNNGFTGTITSNKLVIAGFSGQVNPFVFDTGQHDGYFSVDATPGTNMDSEVVFRLTDSSNFWVADLSVSNNRITLYKIESGAATAMNFFTCSDIIAGHTYTITVYCSGDFICATVTESGSDLGRAYATSAFNKTATKAGCCVGGSTTGSVTFDNFKVQQAA